jgi:ParB-like chromosome segregation protein Spo0J
MSDSLRFHPLAEIFPLLQGDAFEALVADIGAHGLREPITVDTNSAILDGRNRYRACLQAGVAVRTQVFDGGDPVAFIISANLHRRHLDESQRAMVADMLATLTLGSNQHAQICAPTQDEADTMLRVSRRSVQNARKVRQQGTPELIAAVERGEMKVSAAAGVVHLSPARQAARISREKLKADGRRRQADDFYRTPPQTTEALLRVEQFGAVVWEPACGDGAISRVLESRGLTVISNDLHNRGYGEPGRDFLKEDSLLAPEIICNPPFALDDDFAIHALDLGVRKLALLGRVTWLEGVNRHDRLFSRGRLARVWVFSARQTLWRGDDAAPEDDGGMTAYAWFIFQHDHYGRASLDWLRE